MLRFDVPPVWSHVIRWEAFLNFVFCLLAMWISPWVMLVPAAQGLVRGFFGHARCPAHRLWKSIAEARGWGGKKENAGAKMFANKILFIASLAALGLAASGLEFWKVPVSLLLVFTFLEFAFAFCAACWVYGAWYKRFPPRGA
jgi:hypothetical protein